MADSQPIRKNVTSLCGFLSCLITILISSLPDLQIGPRMPDFQHTVNSYIIPWTLYPTSIAELQKTSYPLKSYHLEHDFKS